MYCILLPWGILPPICSLSQDANQLRNQSKKKPELKLTAAVKAAKKKSAPKQKDHEAPVKVKKEKKKSSSSKGESIQGVQKQLDQIESKLNKALKPKDVEVVYAA